MKGQLGSQDLLERFLDAFECPKDQCIHHDVYIDYWQHSKHLRNILEEFPFFLLPPPLLLHPPPNDVIILHFQHQNHAGALQIYDRYGYMHFDNKKHSLHLIHMGILAIRQLVIILKKISGHIIQFLQISYKYVVSKYLIHINSAISQRECWKYDEDELKND